MSLIDINLSEMEENNFNEFKNYILNLEINLINNQIENSKLKKKNFKFK